MDYTDLAFRYLRIGIFTYRKDSVRLFDIPRPFHILSRVLCGSVRLLTPDGSVTEAGAGDTLLIPMGTVYRMEWKGDAPQNGVMFYQLQRDIPQSGIRKLPVRVPLTELPAEGLDTLLAAYRTLQLCAPFLRDAPQAGKEKRVAAVTDYLRTHYTECTPIPTLAALLGLSVPRFHAVFKDCTGTTAVEYRNRVRTEVAMRLLLAGDDAVEAVAEQSGFESAIYFRRVFRQFTGVTPSEYRKRCREENEKE